MVACLEEEEGDDHRDGSGPRAQEQAAQEVRVAEAEDCRRIVSLLSYDSPSRPTLALPTHLL